MYKVCIYNDNNETIIHYPTSDQGAPHLNKLPLKEGLSQVESLSFSVYPNNPGYNSLFELSTKLKVIDIRDTSIRFTGRILSVTPKMDSSGQFFKDVVCEGALSYLNDTKMRSETYLGDPSGFVQWILDKHNEKVETSKRIRPGNINVAGSVAYTCTFDTTLNTILTVKDKFSIDGDIRVRESDGLLYLDWMKNFSSDTVEVALGVNMDDMVKSKDITSLGTRIIPLGANNLTIESVNGGLDYIEDSLARDLYGIIEKTVQYSDVTDPQQLMDKCIQDLSSNTQAKYLLTTTALDLSFISSTPANMFVLGINLHIVNSVLNVDDVYKIISLDLDLLQPYNPKLEIANSPIKSSATINDLRKTSISNNSVHNGVQVGDDFGIRIVSGDGKFVTTLNATEGISIEDVVRNLKMFFVDIENSTLTMDGIQKLTKDGKTVIVNTTNDNGGLFEIYDKDGNLNAKMGSENGTANNIGGTLILYRNGESNARVALGIDKSSDAGVVNLSDSEGVKIALYTNGPNGTGIWIYEDGAFKKLSTVEYVDLEIANLKEYIDQQIASSGGGSNG